MDGDQAQGCRPMSTARELADLLRANPAAVVSDPAVATRIGNAIDGLCDVLIDLHAYHDVPGERDPVLTRIFSDGARTLGELGILASVDTHPKGQDGEAGLVRSKGSAVGEAETPKINRSNPHG